MKSGETQKVGVLRWQGVLADYARRVRIVATVMLYVSCIAFAFTQYGFFEIVFPDGTVTYAMLLLLPIALCALLLGTLTATVLGVFAGAALYLHVQIMPLNFYEMAFVTPLTSIVMLGIMGFMLGLLFALALRKNPSTGKRIIRITLICVIMSILYGLGFLASTITSAIVYVLGIGSSANASDQVSSEALSTISKMASGMGDIGLQTIIDGIFMVLLCVVGDVAARKAVVVKQSRSIRVQFNLWLSVFVMLTFMLTAMIGFLSITQGEWQAAKRLAENESAYLCKQLDAMNERAQMVDQLLKRHGVEDEDLNLEDSEDLSTTLSVAGLLNGYNVKEDGIILILADDAETILACDDETIPAHELVSETFGSDVAKAVDTSLLKGTFERFIYSGVIDNSWFTEMDSSEADVTVEEASLPDVELSYLCTAATNNYKVCVIMPADMVYADRSAEMLRTTISTFVLLTIVFALTAYLLGRVVLRRIDDTNAVLADITAGDLDARVGTGEINEFNSLSTGINDTVVALQGWIAEAETRMDAELATARTIQEAALPRIFPPYPDILRFDIYALMHAAKEVGGDFYDFFLIGDDCGPDAGKLGFVIADVSGKGVPAALFMMKAKTLIRDYLVNGMEVGEAVENANRQLCDGNDTSMFVTTFVGVLDYGQNHIDFVNAGHNPPLLWQVDSWRWLTEKSGLPLGLFDGLPYSSYSLECEIGDQLLLYTDGVTEAMDTEGVLYGEKRLAHVADENYPLHPRALIEVVRQDVAEHARGAQQSDDITILALEVGVPPEITATITVRANVKELPRVNEFIHTELDRRLCPLRAQNQLDIAVEELFVNVCHYAYPDATPENPGSVSVGYTYSADPPSITVDIMDSGIPFDPLAKPDATTPSNILEVPIGGLGILMAKRSVDTISYERVDGFNIVTIMKKW